MMTEAKLLQKKAQLEKESKFNRSRIFRRAHYLTRTEGLTLSQALKQCWAEAKKFVTESRYYLEDLNRQILNFCTPMRDSTKSFHRFMTILIESRHQAIQ